jgi:tape measure domain-containing protein
MAAPQLRLEVSLNLAGFRNEVRKLTQVAQSEFNPLLTVKVNTQDYRAQLKALEKIKPVIKIEDSQIDAARARIGTLNKSLATLRRATSTPIEIKLKYVEVGKPPSAAAGQIGRAVSGRIRADEAVAGLNQKQAVAARNMLKAANVPVSGLGKGRSLEAYQKSIVEGMTKAGDQAIAGLTAGLKDGKSEVAQAAKLVGEGGLRALKDFWGIASPSRVFRQIGEFAVDGLELGFLNGLKDFKNKSVDEIRKITALLRFELAKVSNVSMAPGMSRSAGGRGSRQYMSPIGPLPEGSQEPWAFSQYRYQPFMAQPGQTRGAGVPPMRERFPFAAAPSIMGTTTSPSMFGASFPALPSAGMTGGNAVRQAQLQSRIAAAYARSAAREASVLGESQMYARVSGQVPLGDPTPRLPAGSRGGALALRDAGAQTPLSLDYYKNAVKYSEALKVADASTRNFSASQIPLIGGIKNLAGEFGQAAKQVLLYGTAYKGLAFLTSLPGQILNAAKSQQQFANGLQTATQDTGTFAKELLYVDNVQRAFGLNLETTRTGFTRLYASMAPTGFDSGSIEKLFTGISAATASLQLTPDKAERVIYAFGQMASKGQIMSEELKGQLGDVLPGALAIFSKAAGMSVKEFSKAMEDGEFVGNRFREVFAKVSDELMNRFGTGAQAAGRSLQGLINTVGGDFQRTLESFAPLANSAAQAILGPLGGSLKQLAISAQIATGEIERVFMQLKESQQELKDLRDSAGTDGIITAKETEQIRAAEQNVAALTAKYKSLQQAASDPAIARQAQDITKFTEELGKAGTFVMNVAKAIGGMLSPVLNFLGTNLTTVISLITSFYIGFQTARLAAMALMGVLLLYRTLSAILGFGPAALSANALATAFNGLGIAATGAQVKVIGLRLALTALVASTVIGAVVGGIMLIAGAFASMRDRAKEASQSSRDAAKAAIDAAQTGGVAQAAMSVQTILGESRKSAAARKALEGIMARSTKAQRAGIEPMSLTMEESVALKGSSLTEGMVKPAIGGKPQIRVPSKGDAAAIVRQFGSVAGQEDLSLREAKSALATAQKVAKEVGLNMPTPGATPPEPTGGGGGEDKGADDAKRLREEIARQAAAASDALFAEQQRFLILQQTNPIAEAIAKYTSEEASIQRKLNAGLKEAQSEKEKIDLKEAARLQGAANRLELEQSINDEAEKALKPITDLLASQREELALTTETEKLMKEGISPERAKQIAQVRLLVKQQLEALDLSIDQADAAITEAKARGASAKAVEDLIAALDRLKEKRREGKEQGKAGEEGVPKDKPKDYLGDALTSAEARLKELLNPAYQLAEAAKTIGDAFGEAFKGIITGSMTVQEAFAGMFQSIADHFADMVAQMIAEWAKTQLIKGFQALLGMIIPGFGGIAAGGIGGAFAGSAGGAAGFGGSFDAGIAPLPNIPDYSGAFKTAANGAVWNGGFQAFANGGIVTGPTLGLVGEGKYNEAVIPLPDGKSVPVDLGGMAGGMGGEVTSNIVVNINNGQMQGNGNGNGSELGRKIEGAVKQVLVSELRPGGILSSGRR